MVSSKIGGLVALLATLAVASPVPVAEPAVTTVDRPITITQTITSTSVWQSVYTSVNHVQQTTFDNLYRTVTIDTPTTVTVTSTFTSLAISTATNVYHAVDVYNTVNDADVTYTICAFQGNGGGQPWTACGAVVTYTAPEGIVGGPKLTVASDYGPTFICPIYAYGHQWSANGLNWKYSLSGGNYLNVWSAQRSANLYYSAAATTSNDATTQAICAAAYPDSMGDYFGPNSHTATWRGTDNIFTIHAGGQ